MVSHVSPKSWMGYNGGSDLPTLILARHKKRHPKESHRIRRMLRYKILNKKNSQLPAKIAEEIPWNKICVDLIGPYNIRRKGINPSL